MTAHVQLDSPGAIDGRHIRAVTFQQVRLAYVRQTLERVGLDLHGAPTLVAGSIRGDLARGLAGLGLDVTALDPSPVATELARQHDTSSAIDYRTGEAEGLDGLPDATFALAYYADTFELTPDLDAVLGHAARVLRPGGVLVYDTVTSTPVSRLIYLGAFQAFPATRIMPPGRYRADRLRRPEAVVAALERAGLRSEDITGFKPTGILALVRAVLARRAGRLTDEDIPAAVEFVLDPGHQPVVTYLGSARKPE